MGPQLWRRRVRSPQMVQVANRQGLGSGGFTGRALRLSRFNLYGCYLKERTVALTEVLAFDVGTTQIPINQPVLVENNGTLSAWLTYNPTLPEGYRGHELRPGERLSFPGSLDPLYVVCDGPTNLLVSGLK
jgi:hypothetical protein